jgi:hypothetical protein
MGGVPSADGKAVRWRPTTTASGFARPTSSLIKQGAAFRKRRQEGSHGGAAKRRAGHQRRSRLGSLRRPTGSPFLARRRRLPRCRAERLLPNRRRWATGRSRAVCLGQDLLRPLPRRAGVPRLRVVRALWHLGWSLARPAPAVAPAAIGAELAGDATQPASSRPPVLVAPAAPPLTHWSPPATLGQVASRRSPPVLVCANPGPCHGGPRPRGNRRELRSTR